MRSMVIIIILSTTLGCNNIFQQSDRLLNRKNEYFPSPDSVGGWRTIHDSKKIKRLTSLDKEKLDQAFDYVRSTTLNGGLLIVRNGWLVYEKYFGKGHREATPNLASC